MTNKNIIALFDYRYTFGSKWLSSPYRSGFDKNYLSDLFNEKGYQIRFMNFSEVEFTQNWKDQIVLYTSSEEYGYYYKGFIEDIMGGLNLAGAILIPGVNLLRANNNKVFMEIFRKVSIPQRLQTIAAKQYGTYEESCRGLQNNEVKLPCVIKVAEGSMSRGVFLATTVKEYLNITRKISRTFKLKKWTKEWLRSLKYKGYIKESLHQQKFIVQPFIKNLTNDWKVLIYGNKYYTLKRNVKSNDFRASGSGYNYTAGSESGFPVELFPMIKEFYESLNVPSLSIDFAFDGNRGYIFEFQGIYFGTSTHYKSKDYYEYENGKWVIKNNEANQEELFVYSIVNYIENLDA